MVNSSRWLIVASASFALLSACGEQPTTTSGAEKSAGKASSEQKQIRDQIRIVGSSTVYPFSSYVAEEMGAITDFSTPVVESTGSGGGFKLFCEGLGKSTPDITNASRRMKDSELVTCTENGVTNITEAKIGYDGIVIAQSSSNAALNVTREQLVMATAKEVPANGQLVPNPYTNWQQIDASLPNREITIYGPPTSSGTRDAFEELVLETVTKKMAEYGNEKYSAIRTDGKYIASGENDNLIVQKLDKNRDAVGIFGYSFLEENKGKVQASMVDGVTAEPANISSGDYPVSRSLWFYIKNDHIGKVPGIREYNELFMSEEMIGQGGVLSSIGLIPLPEAERKTRRTAVANGVKVTAKDLAHK